MSTSNDPLFRYLFVYLHMVLQGRYSLQIRYQEEREKWVEETGIVVNCNIICDLTFEGLLSFIT